MRSTGVLTALPEELLVSIFEYLDRWRDQRSVTSTCRQFYRLALPVRYRHIDMYEMRHGTKCLYLSDFLRFLLRNKHVPPLIKRLHLETLWETSIRCQTAAAVGDVFEPDEITQLGAMGLDMRRFKFGQNDQDILLGVILALLPNLEDLRVTVPYHSKFWLTAFDRDAAGTPYNAYCKVQPRARKGRPICKGIGSWRGIPAPAILLQNHFSKLVKVSLNPDDRFDRVKLSLVRRCLLLPMLEEFYAGKVKDDLHSQEPLEPSYDSKLRVLKLWNAILTNDIIHELAAFSPRLESFVFESAETMRKLNLVTISRSLARSAESLKNIDILDESATSMGPVELIFPRLEHLRCHFWDGLFDRDGLHPSESFAEETDSSLVYCISSEAADQVVSELPDSLQSITLVTCKGFKAAKQITNALLKRKTQQNGTSVEFGIRNITFDNFRVRTEDLEVDEEGDPFVSGHVAQEDPVGRLGERFRSLMYAANDAQVIVTVSCSGGFWQRPCDL